MMKIFAVAILAVPTSLVPLACPTAAAQEKRGDVVYIDQAWSNEDRQTYYRTSQGSALMSYDIFIGLEAAGSEELFRSEANSVRYGLLPAAADPKFNPDGLPVGVTKASVDMGQFKGEWVGLTCAACHTGQVEYKGAKIRIDGGAGNQLDSAQAPGTRCRRASLLGDPHRRPSVPRRARPFRCTDHHQ
jgi:hypothetical protein